MRDLKKIYLTIKNTPKFDFALNLALLYSAQLIRFGGSFVITAILYRKYGIATLGNYAILMAIFSLLTALMGWSITAFSVSLTMGRGLKENSIFRIWYLYSFISTLVVLSAGIILKLHFSHILIFAATVFLHLSSSPRMSLVLFKRSQSERSLVLFVESLIYVLLTIILLLKTDFLDAVFWGLFLSAVSRRTVTQLLTCHFKTLPALRVPFSVYIKDMKNLKEYSGFALNGISNVVDLQADSLIVKARASSEDVGLYNVYWKIPNAISQFLWRIGESIFIYVSRAFAKGDYQSIKRYVKKTEFLVLALSSLSAVAYFVGANPLTRIWLGSGIYITVYVRLVLGALLLTSSIRRIYISALYGMGILAPSNTVLIGDILFKIAFVLSLWKIHGVISIFEGWLLSALLSTIYLKLKLRNIILMQEQTSPP